MLTFKHDGRTYTDFTPEGALLAGVPADVVDAALGEFNANVARQKVRAAIASKAGDQASLLGTTADGAQLAIYGLAALVAKLSTANSLVEVREAAEPFAQLSAGFLAKVESGEVVLPFMLKGLNNTVAEIETRATAVSGALQSAQKGG